MYSNCNTKHKHLTIELRKLIEKWKKEKTIEKLQGF